MQKQINIVITGCSQGIGFELVKILGISHNIYAITSNPSILKTKLDEIKSSVIEFNFLTDNISILKSQLPNRVDILINNAGLLINKPFEELNSTDIEQTMAINYKMPLLLIQNLLPKLRKSPIAHVVNIGSMGGFQGSQKFAGLSAYSSSKAAISCITECLAAEFANEAIRFNCLALGAVQTEMLNNAFPDYKAPLNPLEMAKFIAEFALNSWRYINGKTIPVATTSP